MRNDPREIQMSSLKAGAVLALALTFTGAVPALAHNNLNDWMAMMQRIRLQQQARTPTNDAYKAFAAEPTSVLSTRRTLPQRSITPGTRP